MSLLDNPATRITASIVVGGAVMLFVFWLLPVYNMPVGLTDAVDWVFDTVWAFDFMIPVITLMTAFALVLFVDVLFAGIRLVFFLKQLFTHI